MIKLLEKDLRTYRKDTFVTSFFATITILLIVLIICSVPSHAQEISGSSSNGTYSYDTDNYQPIDDIFNIDLNNTNPSGLLARNLNDNIDIIGGTEQNPIYNLYSDSNYYQFATQDNSSLYTSCVSYLDGTMSLPTVFTVNDNTYNLSDYPYFVYCYYGDRNYFYVSSDDTFYAYPRTFIANNTGGFLFSYQTNGWQISATTSYSMNLSAYGLDTVTSHFLNTSGYARLVYSNSHVLGLEQGISSSNQTYFDGMSIELNYLFGQTGNGSGGSSDVETPLNNLVMSNGDWIFKNSKYSAPYDSSFPTGSIYPSGSVSFSFDPTEYQNTNPTAFELVFTFYFQYDVDYKNWNQAFSVFEQTSQLLNNTKRYSHTYNYNDNGSLEIILPLSEFIENGNTKSWTWQDIFDKLENGTFTSVLNNSRELYSVSYNKFDLTATAYIKTADGKSGNITEWYNPMNKKGYTTDDSGGLNKNPYVPSADSDPNNSNSNNNGGNAPGDAGNNGSSTITSNGGNVTVYNYNTNNNNNSLSSEGNTFNDVFNSMLGNNKITSESIADSTGTNGFLTFMNNTISSVPASFFTTLLTFFVTCLGILIVAFILRMLLDIL